MNFPPTLRILHEDSRKTRKCGIRPTHYMIK